jgi:hypothetical protein
MVRDNLEAGGTHLIKRIIFIYILIENPSTNNSKI